MSLFGSSTAAKPAFGTATTTSTFSFPSTTSTTTPAKPLFGTTTAAASTPSLFGNTTTASPSGGGLFAKKPALVSQQATTNLFANTAPPTTQATTTTTATTGGLFSNTKPAFGSATTTGGLFGSKPTTGGLFGSTATTTTAANQQNQLCQPQQQALTQYHPFVKAVGNPQVTGNDNDKIIAELNQLGAALGVGKGVYRDNNQLQTINLEGNQFMRFVAVGYNRMSEYSDPDGVVSIVMKVPVSQLSDEDKINQVLSAVQTILGNQQNTSIQLAPGASVQATPDNFTEICVICKEGGFVVPSLKFAQVLNDANRLTQLETQLKVDKTRVLAKIGMTKAQKERYLEAVPQGVDETQWKLATIENPNPAKLLPVAVRGWDELRARQIAQVEESKVQRQAIQTAGKQIEELENVHSMANVELEQIRCRHKQLSYRLLRVLLAQWIKQRFSKQIDTEEDQLEAILDMIMAKLNRPNQIKAWISHFNEVLETRQDDLKQGGQTYYEMTTSDQKYAQKFLTDILYLSERLSHANDTQQNDLGQIRKLLEGE